MLYILFFTYGPLATKYLITAVMVLYQLSMLNTGLNLFVHVYGS